MTSGREEPEAASILVVDDEPTERLLLAESLSQAGYSVTEAEDGNDGLAQFRRSTPDMVLLDVDMPGMDGFETCRRIRLEPSGSEVPVVMVTGLDDTASMNRAYLSGATDFITKPINWEIIGYRLRYMLRAARATAALQGAKAEVDRANRLKAQFLNNMSHEVRTPVNGVVGMLDLLRDTKLDEEQRDYVETAQGSAEKLMRLLNELLDFANLETALENSALEKVNFSALLGDTRSRHLSAARNKGIELRVSSDPAIPDTLIGNPSQVLKILTILVDNAIKFSDRGEVVVDAHLECEQLGCCWIKCEVTDTGIGIDPALADQIFEPFAQGDGSTTRRFGGTGVGLAIAKRIVEKMGWQLGVSSQVGKGSAFWLRLPFATEN